MRKGLLLILVCFMICGCVSNSSKTVQEPRYEFYCEEGTLYGKKCKIVSYEEPNITCPEGFPYNDNLKKCANIISIAAVGKYVCKEGYKLENGKCISEKTYEKEDGKCPKDTTTYNGKCKEIKYRSYEYHCPAGTLNGKKCELADEKKPEITCPEGYEVNQRNVSCEKVTYEEAKVREIEAES